MSEQFIKYAQNFEDIMLWRALNGVKNGFYIDLGAAEPETNSVTKAFYDRGWHGINVEPTHHSFERLNAARPRDVNLNVGVWDTSGELTLFFVDDGSELSTTNPWLRDYHQSEGRKIREEKIPVLSLVDICSKHVPEGSEIHFLKVDVEGAEIEAFKGHDFNRWRPWIILVESHEPERKSLHWQPFDKMIVGAGYTFVHCDGINRFYIENSRLADLAPAFEVPANVYDNWISAGEANWMARWQDAHGHLENAQARIRRLEAELDEIRIRAESHNVSRSLMSRIIGKRL